MEVLLLTALVAHFVGMILVMRYFFKRLADRLPFLTPPTTTNIPHVSTGTTTPNPLFRTTTAGTATNYRADDPASPNQLAEDENDFEFSEQNMANLPSNVKFTVEGGDTNTPPGFEETNGK